MDVQKNDHKILAISGDDINNMGGGEKALLSLCNTMEMNILSINRRVKDGFQMKLPDRCSVIYIRTLGLKLGSSTLYIPAGLFTGQAIKRTRNFSFLISFSSNIFTILFTVLIRKLEKKPILLFLHDPTVFERSNGINTIYRKLQLILIKFVPNLHVELPDQASFLIRNGYRGRIHQFPIYFPINVDKNDIKPAKRFIVLFVGRMDIRQKGIDLLVEIVRNVVSRGAHIEFHIVGADYGGAQMIKQVESEFPDTVKYLGRVAEEHLRKEYQQSSLFICTSRYETLGLSVLEAMNFGIKVISFDVSGPNTLVEERFGVRIKPFDNRKFAEAVYGSYKMWNDDPGRYNDERLQRIEDFKEKFELNGLILKVREMLDIASVAVVQ